LNRSTSLYLDIVRPIAAFVVLLSHASMESLSGGQMHFMGSMGVQAVDVFFVLSGFVIAHVSATREQDAGSYAISRVARIYSVAIPALILTAVLDTIGIAEDISIYQDSYQALSVGALIRSVLFLGEQWNNHRFLGSNGPYWSLGFEVWYYLAFGIFLFAPRRWRWWAVFGVLVFIGPKVALLFPAWLMGVLAYRVIAAQRLSRLAGWILFAVPIGLFAGYQWVPHSPLQQFMPVTFDAERLRGTAQDLFISGLFCAHLIGYATVSDVFGPLLERHARSIRWISGATFSIYLTHLPIMRLVAAISPWPRSSPCTLILLVVATLMGCLAFAEISERRKEFWRRLLANASAKRRLPKTFGSPLNPPD
jgi:peptidoglycan/LPS O-acetylase OafA/YrhL